LSDSSDARAKSLVACYLIVMTAQPDGDAAVAWLPHPVPVWQLPAVNLVDGSDCPGAAEEIRRAMFAELGLEGHVLCHLVCRQTSDSGQGEQVIVVEARQATIPRAWRPVTFDWFIGNTIDPPEHAVLLAHWLHTSSPDPVPPQRVAWAMPGWRSRAEAWIKQQLAALGVTLTGPITVRKIWSISCVLRVPTSAGDFYFKAVPPLFGREPALTEALARRHPGQVPEVVALDTAQGWMLMRGFAGSMLSDSQDLSVWQAALRAYAGRQIAWRADLDTLRRLGCPDRGPLRLAEQIDPLLADDELLVVGRPRGLTAAQVAELRALAPRLKAACAEWAAAGVPVTLEHGDYHAANVAVNGGQFIVFDWTDGCIAHPFVCLPALLENARPDWHAALTGAYLESWSDIASPGQLENVLRRARPLAALHMAVSYYDIYHAGEPMVRWQMDGAAPYFLREVLNFQDHL
jgi:hypothetical protein